MSLKGTQGQWHSRALKGNQGQSRAQKGTQRQSRAIKGTQRHSRAIKGTQGHSRTIKDIQGHLRAFRDIQRHSKAIKGTQGRSKGPVGQMHAWHESPVTALTGCDPGSDCTRARPRKEGQGDMNYRGTDSACAVRLIPTCSPTSAMRRRRPASRKMPAGFPFHPADSSGHLKA